VTPDDIYAAQLLLPSKDGGVARRHKAGRFAVKGGRVVHLEDYHGALAGKIPEGPLTKATELAIKNPGPDLSVASMRDVISGRRLDFIPEHRFAAPLPPSADKLGSEEAPEVEAYLYHRAGYEKPHVLEARRGALALDGSELSPEESAAVVENLRSGAASLRRAGHLAKADRGFTPEEALAHLEGGAPQTEESKDAVAALRRHIFEDPMNPGVGNKYAYNQYRAKDHPGVWGSLDLNDFKHVNDRYGHDMGDELIRAVGNAFRAGADPQKVKLFRPGGDEYAIHASNPADAYAAVRKMRERLDELPALMGEYKPSMSVGFGNDFPSADRALLQAKKGKFDPAGQRLHAPGSAPHLAHSLIPGSEGPVPLGSDVTPPLPSELEPGVFASPASGGAAPEVAGGVGKPAGAPAAPADALRAAGA
jgi:diguanylate cyclase (GGDEF)-like protein